MVRQKRKEESETRLAGIIQQAMDKKKLSIREVAEKLGTTYEHVRGVVRGLTVPSDLALKELCRALDIDFGAVAKLVVADRILAKYGTIPLELAGKNPELEPIERVWDRLSNEHKSTLVMMAQTFANKDKASTRK